MIYRLTCAVFNYKRRSAGGHSSQTLKTQRLDEETAAVKDVEAFRRRGAGSRNLRRRNRGVGSREESTWLWR